MKSIFRSTLVVGLVSVIAIVTTTNSASAQVQAQPASRTQNVQQGHAHEGHAHGEHEHGKETIAFNLPQWKTMHFDDATKATQHAEMVKKLGCEVKQGQHSGHIDLAPHKH